MFKIFFPPLSWLSKSLLKLGISNTTPFLNAGGGFFYKSNTASVVTITTAGNFFGFTDATASVNWGGVTFADNATADRLVIGANAGGKYMLQVSSSFGATGNSTIKGSIFINGIESTEIGFVRKISVGGDTGTVSPSGVIELADNDIVDFRFTSDGNGDVVNVFGINVNMIRAGD